MVSWHMFTNRLPGCGEWEGCGKKAVPLWHLTMFMLEILPPWQTSNYLCDVTKRRVLKSGSVAHYRTGWATEGSQLWVHETQGLLLYHLLTVVLFSIQPTLNLLLPHTVIFSHSIFIKSNIILMYIKHFYQLLSSSSSSSVDDVKKQNKTRDRPVPDFSGNHRSCRVIVWG